MTTTRPHWDTEEVLAFVHDVRPWRDLDDGERAEWCRRVKHVRDNVTDSDGGRWTNARLAAMFGLAQRGLEQRFTSMKAISDDVRTLQNQQSAARHARSTMRNPNITPKEKAAIVAEADAETKQAILEHLLDEQFEQMPFGGEKPKVPGEGQRNLVNDINSLSVNILSTLGVLEVKLAEASVEEIEESVPVLATVAHRSSEVCSPFVPSADTVEDFLRDRSGK
jgi:hypothetical protein